MKTKLLLILLLLFSISNALSLCTESLEKEEQVILKMKTELICQNSLSECQNIIVKIDGIASFDQNECANSDIQIESTKPMIPDYLFGMAAIASEINGTQKREYVNSVVDFYHHTQLHKKRVVELAANLVETFPEEFKGIDKEMINRILSVHDNAKIGHNFRFSDGKAYYEKLYEYYGKRPPMEIINSLNDVDKSIMRQTIDNELFQLTKSMSVDDAAKFKEEFVGKLSRVENLADFVDRAMNPVSAEEFGRQMFLESNSNTSKEDVAYKKMALYLEQNYKKIVQI